MKNIQNKINTLRYGYRAGEFLPVYSGGEMLNKRDFVAYKLRCIVVKRTLI